MAFVPLKKFYFGSQETILFIELIIIPNNKYKASLFAHVSGTYDTYTLVENISVTELTPDNIEPLLNRYLKLKAFL